LTKQEFLDNINLEIDAMVSLGSPGYTPLEISSIATLAQEELIIRTYESSSNRLKEGFEETEKRIQDLGELVVPQIFTIFTPSTFYNNGFEVILPNTLITNGPTDFTDVYWLPIYEEVESDQLDCSILNNTTIYTKPYVYEINHAELKRTLRNPFRKPTKDKVLRIRIEGRKHVLITDGTYNIQRYFLSYIKKPTPIDLTTNLTNQVSQLSDIKHRELLDSTIKRLLKDTQADKQLRQLQIENQGINPID